MNTSQPRKLIWTTIAALAAALAATAAQARQMPPDPGAAVTTLKVPHCSVPAVRGLTVAAATNKIVEANCSVGKIVRRRSRLASSRVVGTNPRAGRYLAAGWEVRIVVSRGR